MLEYEDTKRIYFKLVRGVQHLLEIKKIWWLKYFLGIGKVDVKDPTNTSELRLLHCSPSLLSLKFKGEKRIDCSQCDATFSNKYGLKKHWLKCHDPNNKSVKQTPKEKRKIALN